ncbi:hypothetical protein K435DRAFT_857129 [Dendrothele bispora CBS 962.96]|uniref:Uncharacterized protein n=1 Tax=Dendrothele bispora (strain CBS 962.96) TaxID=1314807 RepID=A0A4S8M6T3_DENBC|nr:hypothetical protein K435DRAFT_857129 [Dendrothele bispora CBS 962.96]
MPETLYGKPLAFLIQLQLQNWTMTSDWMKRKTDYPEPAAYAWKHASKQHAYPRGSSSGPEDKVTVQVRWQPKCQLRLILGYKAEISLFLWEDEGWTYNSWIMVILGLLVSRLVLYLQGCGK